MRPGGGRDKGSDVVLPNVRAGDGDLIAVPSKKDAATGAGGREEEEIQEARA